jgi:hypothetical protein
MPHAADTQSLEDFFALQHVRVRAQADRAYQRAQTRLKNARALAHQAQCDADLDAQPFVWASALGPRARSLSVIEGDETE